MIHPVVVLPVFFHFLGISVIWSVPCLLLVLVLNQIIQLLFIIIQRNLLVNNIASRISLLLQVGLCAHLVH